MLIINILAKVSLLIALSSAIFSLIVLSVFLKLLKKHGDKRVEEIEPQLSKLLNLMQIGTFIFLIFGLIGTVFR